MDRNNHSDSISPYTGWTFREWQAVAQALFLGAYANVSPGKALVQFQGTRPSIYGPLSDGVEGFARMFLLVGFWLYHRRDGFCTLEDGTQVDWVDLYRQGMVNGTDPEHPEYWGDISGKHQYMVEAASMSIALHFSRHLIWNSFSTTQQHQIGQWLRHILQFPFEDKNWVLFGVMINSFLKSVEQEFYQDQIDFYLERFDSYYEADGWYRDGVGPQFDHYNPWALHFYPHLWSAMDPDSNRPELVELFEHRSRLFLETFAHYFSSTASHPAFGRSLIYRCAPVAAAIVGTWKEYSPLSPGLTRRLCSQSLKFFVEHSLLESDGSVPLGWTRRFVPMAEKYSGPASPLWLNKVFSAFLMPENHPFWVSVEEPLPIEQDDYCISHPVPGFLVQGHRQTGHIQLINQGSDAYVNAPTDWKTPASDSFYLKFAYSSHFLNHIDATKDGLVCDNMISLYEEKRGFSHRGRIYPLYVDDRIAIAYHYPFGERYSQKRDSRVESAVIMKADHQVRIHWVISPNRPLVYEGGYPLSYDDQAPEILQGADWVSVVFPEAQCCVRALQGYDTVGVSYAEGIHPQGEFSCLPYLSTTKPVIAQAFFACEVIARPACFDVESELALVASCTFEGRRVTLVFSDGEILTLKLGSVERDEQKAQWSRR